MISADWLGARQSTGIDLALMTRRDIRINGIEYANFQPNKSPVHQIDQLYPLGGPDIHFSGTFLFDASCRQTQLRWRAFDQYRMYPTDDDEFDNFAEPFPSLALTQVAG